MKWYGGTLTISHPFYTWSRKRIAVFCIKTLIGSHLYRSRHIPRWFVYSEKSPWQVIPFHAMLTSERSRDQKKRYIVISYTTHMWSLYNSKQPRTITRSYIQITLEGDQIIYGEKTWPLSTWFQRGIRKSTCCTRPALDTGNDLCYNGEAEAARGRGRNKKNH